MSLCLGPNPGSLPSGAFGESLDFRACSLNYKQEIAETLWGSVDRGGESTTRVLGTAQPVPVPMSSVTRP